MWRERWEELMCLSCKWWLLFFSPILCIHDEPDGLSPVGREHLLLGSVTSGPVTWRHALCLVSSSVTEVIIAPTSQNCCKHSIQYLKTFKASDTSQVFTMNIIAVCVCKDRREVGNHRTRIQLRNAWVIFQAQWYCKWYSYSVYVILCEKEIKGVALKDFLKNQKVGSHWGTHFWGSSEFIFSLVQSERERYRRSTLSTQLSGSKYNWVGFIGVSFRNTVFSSCNEVYPAGIQTIYAATKHD